MVALPSLSRKESGSSLAPRRCIAEKTSGEKMHWRLDQRDGKLINRRRKLYTHPLSFYNSFDTANIMFLFSWEYLPFGGGPRICIGQHLAVTEAAYTTARLIQAFQHIEPKTEGPFQEAFAMVITSGDGCQVSFRRAA